MYGIIYKITNLVNNKVYIGQTRQKLKRRFKQHINKANANIYHNKFHNAIRKYGKDNFSIEQIDEGNSQEELSQKEIYWIKHYNSMNEGYNSTSGGEESKAYTEEVKKHISEGLKNSTKFKEFNERRTISKYHCFELNETLTYKEFCEKYPEYNFADTGIIACCEKKYTTSANMHWCYEKDIDTYTPREDKSNKTPVYCVELNRIFNTIAEAEKEFNCRTAIQKVCAGIKHTAKGYHWCYLKDKDTFTIPINKKLSKVYCLEENKTYTNGAKLAEEIGVEKSSVYRVCTKNKNSGSFKYTCKNFHYCWDEDKELLLKSLQ